MKNQYAAFERRIEMLYLLSRYKKSSFVELANLYEVSTRTIYADIVFLSRYAPIYTKNGKNGGVFLMNEYRNDLNLHLSKDEEELLEKLAADLNGRNAQLLRNVLNKYSMPNIGT